MKHCILIGAGGHARVVADTLRTLYPEVEVIMLDDQFPRLRDNDGVPVVGKPEQLAQFRNRFSVGLAALGDAAQRLRSLDRLRAEGFETPVLIHPSAWVSPRASLGAGTVVLAGAVVQAGAQIGPGCIINTGASADHDCRLSEGVHLAPGARLAGGVSVGARTWIGIGAVVKEYTSLGEDVMVGAGAAVIDDIEDGQTVVGVPAASKQTHEA